MLIVSTNAGFRAKPAGASSITDVALVQQQIDKSITTQPQPSWDEIIKPELIKLEEQRQAAALAAAQAKVLAAAQAQAAQAEAARIEQARLARLPQPFGTFSNSYNWGNCTWYVASRKQIPNTWGNANTWLANAQAEGWATGSSPQVGAIAQTTAGWAGHVAIVEAVDNTGTQSRVLVSEMNYNGLDVIDQRWAGANEFSYIY